MCGCGAPGSNGPDESVSGLTGVPYFMKPLRTVTAELSSSFRGSARTRVAFGESWNCELR